MNKLILDNLNFKKTDTVRLAYETGWKIHGRISCNKNKFNSFMDMCKNTEALPLTLQPINKFDFDAAIIFSDILLI